MFVHFSKGYIVSCVCLLLGVYFCFTSLLSLLHKNTAIPLDELTLENCTLGQYVYGDIETFVSPRSDSVAGGKANYGASQTIDSVDVYTIPIADDYYIRFMVTIYNNKKELEKFDFTRENHLYIEGRIVRTTIELNDVWYERSVEFENREYKDVIIKDLCIIDMDFDKRIGRIKYGVAFIILSIVFFFLSGGAKNLIQVREVVEDEKPSYSRMRYTHHTQSDLEEERKHLSSLYERLDKRKKECLYELPLFPLGAWLAFSPFILRIRALGLTCMFLSLSALVRYFMNSNMSAALSIAKRFYRKSLWLQIMESSKKVQILQNLIEENAASKNQMPGVK